MARSGIEVALRSQLAHLGYPLISRFLIPFSSAELLLLFFTDMSSSKFRTQDDLEKAFLGTSSEMQHESHLKEDESLSGDSAHVHCHRQRCQVGSLSYMMPQSELHSSLIEACCSFDNLLVGFWLIAFF